MVGKTGSYKNKYYYEKKIKDSNTKLNALFIAYLIVGSLLTYFIYLFGVEIFIPDKPDFWKVTGFVVSIIVFLLMLNKIFCECEILSYEIERFKKLKDYETNKCK